jgi:hypothetical protein
VVCVAGIFRIEPAYRGFKSGCVAWLKWRGHGFVLPASAAGNNEEMQTRATNPL